MADQPPVHDASQSTVDPIAYGAPTGSSSVSNGTTASQRNAATAATSADASASEGNLTWHETHKEEYQEALMLKEAGNQRFKASQYDEAIELYNNALSLLPAREDDEEKAVKDDEEVKPAEEEEDEFVPDVLSREVRDLRAQLHANVGTCRFKQEKWKDAVAACAEALRDDPSYVKALQRRAAANEKINSWSSLSAALEDYKTLYALPDLPPAQNAQAKSALTRLPPLVDKRKESETAEVLGKLKDLGNSFLGKFGLSTDNYKMSPNGSGGYSLNMNN